MRKLYYLLLSCLILVHSQPEAINFSLEVFESLYAALTSDPRLDLLSNAFLVDPEIQQWLVEPPLTVIAPTDEAFHKAIKQRRIYCDEHIPCQSFSNFLNSSVLQTTLLRHVFSGNITATDLLFYQELRSLNGIHTKVEYVENWSLRIGGAHIVEVRPEIVFQFGSIILVDDILIDSSRITPSYMEIAEYVADIGPFDENEINSAAEAAMENIECFRKIRSVKLAVDTPWLFKFQPFQETPRRLQPIEACPEKRMKKFNVPSSSRKYRSRFDDSNILWKIPKDIKLPKKKSDLAFMSILELASLLRQGLVTSVELTQLYLSRLRKSDMYLKAVITYTEELALQKAQQADREMKMGIFRTPLHGIPYGLKDIIAVPGYPTTWGSKALQNQTFKEASWVYKKLSGAGAVHVAKLATGAMAWGDAWFGGKTKNPWNIQESSCGSSSGSGATASAGLIPFSIGTETWGSIACPASAMGITAIRPTFGSVGRSGTMQLAWSLDKIGAFCRTAIDCAIVLDSLRGADPNDSSSIYAPMTNPQSIKPHKLTIGYTVNSDPDVVRQFEEELGLQMELMNLNIDYPTDEIINILVGAEASGSFDEWIRENEISSLSNDEKWIAFVRGARLIPVAEYLLANKVRSELIAFESKLLSTVDAILVPAKGAGNQGALGNLLGIPEVVFPTGFDTIYGSGYSQRKIPKTQALIGAPFSDGKLLGIVALYQNLTNYHLQMPPMETIEPLTLQDCFPFSSCTQKPLNHALIDG